MHYQKEEARSSLENSLRAPDKIDEIISTWPGLIISACVFCAVIFATPVCLSLIARAIYGG